MLIFDERITTSYFLIKCFQLLRRRDENQVLWMSRCYYLWRLFRSACVTYAINKTIKTDKMMKIESTTNFQHLISPYLENKRPICK